MDNNAYSAQGRRPLSVDGLRPAPPPPQVAHTLAPNSGRPTPRLHSKPKPQTHHERRLLQKLQMPLLLLAGTVGGLLVGNLMLGLGLLAIYGIFAFVTRIPSRTTFTLALLLLAAISLLLLLKPNAQLVSNFASYAFILLLIGTITLGREAKMPKRMPRRYKR